MAIWYPYPNPSLGGWATVGVPYTADMGNNAGGSGVITATLNSCSVSNAVLTNRLEGDVNYANITFTVPVMPASALVHITFTLSELPSNGPPLTQSYTVNVKAAEILPPPPVTPPVSASLFDVGLNPVAAVKNVAFSQSIGFTNQSGTTWAITAQGTLPGGVTLSNSGILAGTIATAGAYQFTVTATKSGFSNVVRDANLVVTEAAIVSPPALPPVPPQTKITRESYSATEWLLTRVANDVAGALLPTQDSAGTVDYATGVLYFPPEMLFDYKRWSSVRENGTGEWIDDKITDTWAGGSQISVTYQNQSVTPTATTETLPPAVISINLTPYSTDSIVPGTVQFRIGTTIYADLEGVIYRNPDATGYGIPAGTIDYASGYAVLDNWVAGSPAFTLQSLATLKGQFGETEFYFRTSGAPLRPAGFQLAATAIDGELITAAADVSGDLISTDLEGTVDTEYGLVDVRFGDLVLDSSLTAEEKAEEWYDIADIVAGYIWKPRRVIPQTARYNAVIYSYLPLPASLLGLNPVRLPMDGRVPFCRPGDSAVVHHTATLTLPNPAIGAATYDVGRTGLARIWLKDANGQTVPGGIGGKYSADLDTGIITMAVGLDLTGYAQPLVAYHMIAAEGLISDVDVSGQVKFASAIQQAFPLGSYLSTELRIGDLGARVTVPFSQQSWTSVWSDTRIGNVINPQFSQSIYPIVVTNDGAAQERWRVQFTATTTVDVIGETLGVIATGLSILSNIAPNNPVTGQPYFTIPYQGWGAGWISGYLLRFNTLAADYPIAVLRCVQQGPAGAAADRLGIEFLGDVDA